MTRPKDEMGSQIVPSESDISPRCSSDTYLSKSEQQLPSSSSTLSSSDSAGAWIFNHFQIQMEYADECVAPGRHQPQETCWTSDRRLSSPETNLKVGLLPLVLMQLLLLHVFLSFMVRTSPLIHNDQHLVTPPTHLRTRYLPVGQQLFPNQKHLHLSFRPDVSVMPSSASSSLQSSWKCSRSKITRCANLEHGLSSPAKSQLQPDQNSPWYFWVSRIIGFHLWCHDLIGP